MDAGTDNAQTVLHEQLAKSRERLERQLSELRAVDAELDALALERRQHRLLGNACVALEELGGIGGAGLFWGDSAGAANGELQLRRARGRVDAFEKWISEIEERREVALEELERRQLETDGISDEVFEAQEAERERLEEWIVEREISDLPPRALVMPWARRGEEDSRFRRSLAAALLSSLLFAGIVRQIDLPLLTPEDEAVEVPERVVRLMMKARPLPPPPVRETRPEQELVAQQKPVEDTTPQEAPKTESGPGEGPGRGPAKGLLAFREKFSGFAETQNVARLGSQARIDDSGRAASGPVERAMLTTQAPGSSGGINLASLSRGVGGGGGSGAGTQIARVQVARATTTIGGGGSGRSSSSASGGGPPLGRTDEEIQIVFDRHKSALYRLYNRELRSDPTLKGQMILRLTIEPDGSVSLCELRGTDMHAPQLASQVLDRVRTFDFGAKEGIARVTILYPIDFLPAT